ncbi:MAG TPA: putative cobaltochelatase [Methanospirillum sp.]|uniref:putative cobaltochelatase n=1 Tax=Methanospirillum sp. TaxID=45200 RepID=UPI002B7F2E23|nr:putative cobaltochelatase [Methanospirillum sp.]HOJ97233.1 putative cobaltochelatase [Methanospirillum sp.]
MTHHLKKPLIPFTAIVGQEQMKKALLLNAINPAIGGVLIRGEKGTAKSSTVRALAEILPVMKVVPGCPFSCDPKKKDELCEICAAKKETNSLPEPVKRQIRVVNLPVGATEDRVVGTIDIERALKEGIKALEPGILAEANRGILYIDEVNLLDDHVVDVLLDAAAMGVNTVEREGISFSHPARFILIGTMNPEEGELRPQLLDRFGLQVSVEAIENPKERIEIVRTAEEFLQNPDEFRKKFKNAQKAISKQIIHAMRILPKVTISDALVRKAVDICISLGVRTHRAEITIVRTAKTIAAFDGRDTVTQEDLREAIELALPHRMRRRPFEEPKVDPQHLDDLMNEPPAEQSEKPQETSPEQTDEHRDAEPQKESSGQENQDTPEESRSSSTTPPQEQRVFGIGSPINMDQMRSPEQKTLEKRYAPGRRYETNGADRRGQYIGAQRKLIGTDIAFDATIRAVAPYQNRRRSNNLAVVIRGDEVLQKRRIGKTATACLFVVDASGSMGVEQRMEAAKGAVFSLLEDSYQNRDRVGLIAFRGEKADLILPLTSSIDLAYARLSELPTGGKTPLTAGLQKALTTLLNEKRKYPSLVPILILITDGRANVGNGGRLKDEITSVCEDLARAGIETVIIDTEARKKSGFGLQLGFCPAIAEHTRGRYYRMSDLTMDTVSGAVLSHIAENLAVS